MAENNSSAPLKTAEGSYPALPAPDTHCHDEDTGRDVWSYSAEQMRAYAAQAVAAQAAPAANQIASQGQEAKPVVEKLAFVNGAPAACGCRHEFSSGGGEYSDVAYVHLCPAHAGVVPRNVLDDEWRRRLLDGAAIERDEMGCGEHPALPLLEEGMKPKQFFDALGIELQCVMAEDQMDMDAYEAMIEVPNYNAWTPGAPDGEEWKQVAIFDTEDGPACWWIREAPPSPRIRHPRNTPAAVAVPPKAITASLMLDDGGERPVYCLMAAYPSEADARAALAALAAIPEPPATEDSSAGDLAEVPASCLTMEQAEAIAFCSTNEPTSLLRHWFRKGYTAAAAQAEVQAEPVAKLSVHMSEFDAGEIRKAASISMIWKSVNELPLGDYQLYTAPQAQPADALDAIQNPQEMADWLIAMRSRLGSCREASQAWSEEIGLKSWDNYTTLSAAFAAMAAAQEGGNAAKEA